MTAKDKSTIERMLGRIEGVAFALDNEASEPLLDAVEIIGDILDKKEGAEE